MPSSALKIIQHFDAAASRYDAQASLQAQVAHELVALASAQIDQPKSLLDIGSGTGFIASALHQRWPRAKLTAVDQSPKMLRQVEQKIRHVRTIRSDASTLTFTEKFDGVFSSMVLHWLQDPYDVLQRWQGFLKPEGKIFVATLVDGSFLEWRNLCAKHGVNDGLWAMPPIYFARSSTLTRQHKSITITYKNAQAFLQRLKATGTATPRQDHTPLSPSVMRRLLQEAPQPFLVTYQVLYIGNLLPGSV